MSGGSPQQPQSRGCRPSGGAIAPDLDADGAVDHVDLADADAQASHARVFQHRVRDLLRKGLHELHVAAPDGEPDRVQNDVVGEDRAHVVGVTRGAAHRDLDVEHDPLRRDALEIVGADMGVNHEVADKNVVDLALVIPAADDAAGEQPPVDFRRPVAVGALSRNEIANQREALRIEPARPIVIDAERAAESEHVRTDEKKPRRVGRLERPRKAADEAVHPASGAEVLEARDVEMIEQPACALAPGVEHRSLEAERREPRQDVEIRLIVGEQDADETRLARKPGEPVAQALDRVAVDGELETVHLGGRERARPVEQACPLVRRVAEGGARLAASRDLSDDRLRNRKVDGRHRARRGVLEVDDVRAEMNGDVRLGGVRHARQHARHRAARQPSRRPPRFAFPRLKGGSTTPILIMMRACSCFREPAHWPP